MDVDSFKNVVSFTASICTIIQFLSGTIECQKFVKAGSTGDTSSFPFISGVLSTALWLRYGFLINDSTVILVNTIGATLFFSYVITFFLFSIKKSLVLKQIFISLLVLIGILYYSIVDSNDAASLNEVKNRVGTLSCLMTVVFFAAPLISLLHVVKVKNSESLPFAMISSNFFVSLQWFAYGVLIDDYFLEVTNFLGVALSAVQLTLFVIYPSKKLKSSDLV